MHSLSTNNLFGYATSELSQDAFISWLLSHALKENLEINPLMTECALEFLHKITMLKNVTHINAISRQTDKIDVLVQGDGFELIIEDKTFTHTHHNQIANYHDIRASKVPNGTEIICVLYKIVEQCYKENGVDFEYTREVLLGIMRKYRQQSNNVIFNDYVDYLEYIEEQTQSYNRLPIEQWNSDAYRGFFVHLEQDLGVTPSWWGYVSNPSGGFQCFTFDFITREQLNSIGITEDYLESLYLQIEDHIIAVKMSAGKDREKGRDIRQRLFDYFKTEIQDFEKKTFRYGRWMTIGYINYNEKNYKEKINEIQKASNGLKEKFKMVI